MKLFCWHKFVQFGFIRTLLLSAVVLACVLSLAIVIGCDKAEKHKVLTFFFDGVPPLGLEYLDPNSSEYAEQLKKLEAVARASNHETGKECFTVCHDKSGVKYQQVPEMCYTCHEDYSHQSIHVHAPVLIGDCLFCHRPHESPNSFLLKKGIPALCYKCHDKEAVILIENHDDDKYNMCITCHSAHASSSRHLLKGGVKHVDSPREIQDSVPEITDPNATQGNKTDR